MLIEHANRIIRFVDRGSPGLVRDDRHAFSYVYLLMPLTYLPQKPLWTPTHEDYQRLREVFDRMTRHRLPGMRIFGMSGLLWVDQATNGLTPEQVRDRAQTILAFAKPKINDPGVPDADSERVACYEALLNVVNAAALAEADRFKLIDDIFGLMLTRKEAVEGVIEMAAFPQTTIYANYYPLRYGNLPLRPAIIMRRSKISPEASPQ